MARRSDYMSAYLSINTISRAQRLVLTRLLSLIIESGLSGPHVYTHNDAGGRLPITFIALALRIERQYQINLRLCKE